MTSSLDCVGLDLRQTVWSLSPSPHGLVEVRGPDASDYLHRLCSQDVLRLPDGGVAAAAFLNPKGKLQAAVLVARAGDAYLLEVESTQAKALEELLSRYHFTEKLTIRVRDDLVCNQLLGDRAPAALGLAPQRCKALDGGGVALAASCRGLVWVRVHGARGAVPAWPLPTVALSSEQAEALRIAAGIVRVGVDTDASTLGPEAMLEDALSATKGCYTGQEIVARLSTYGHLNRRLCVVRVSSAAALAPGTTLVELEDHEPVGRITSSAPLPHQGGVSLALAYLPREFWKPGSELRARGADGPPVYVLDFGAAEQSAT